MVKDKFANIPGYERRKVKVKDAYKIDAERGRIRVDPDIIKEISLRTGDVIEVYHPIS